MSQHLLRLAGALLCVAFAGCDTTARSETEAQGEVLFRNNCSVCHGAEAEGNQEQGAPPLAGQEAWYLKAQLEKFHAGFRGAHFDDTEGLRMRPMAITLRGDDEQLSAEKVEAVTTYLASLPAAVLTATVHEGNAEAGATVYQTCKTCHGTSGQGLKAQNAPAIVHLPDWYVLRQLHKFQAGVRGKHPQDITGMSMRAMVLALDEQQMKDVAAYVRSLGQ